MTDSSHPSVDKFKSQAKELKRKTNLSLMQAQTVIAKKNGYNNWHDFVQKLKNIFEPKYSHEIKPEEVTSTEFEKVPRDGFFHIGREANTEHWISLYQARSHVHIIEEHSSIYSLDVYLAQQAITNGQPVVFSSSDIEATKVLINFAFTNSRKKVYLFDPMGQITDFEIYRVHRPRLSLPDTTISSLSRFLSQYNDGNVQKDEFMNFLQLVSAITIYQKEIEGIKTTLNSLVANGNLIQFQKYCEIFSNNHPMKGYLQDGINLLLNDTTKQNLFEQTYLSIIEKIKATNLFNNNPKDKPEIKIETLYYKEEEYPILIFLSNETQLPESVFSKNTINYYQLVNFTLINCYHILLMRILGTPIESRNNFEYQRRLKNDSIAFIMRNPPLFYFSFGCMSAHNRAIASSFIFTFNNLPSNWTTETEYLLDSATNYFFGKFTKDIESDYNIKQLFDQKLSKNLITQAYHVKTINCKYKSSDIEDLRLNEYIYFNQMRLLKVAI